MKPRNPQLALRLEAPPDPCTHWRDGARLAYLGGTITLQLDTDRKQACLDATVLHLPLPPEAATRQIRDAAEAWLRREAGRVFKEVAARVAAAMGCRAPRLALSFAVRGGWIRPEPDALRCSWRLVEQPAGVIEQAIARAIAAMPRATMTGDLFA
jgi:hypothetical protein